MNEKIQENNFTVSNNENNNSSTPEELKKLLKDILPKEVPWYKSSKPNIWRIESNSCSNYVRTTLYGQIWKIKWLINKKNNLKLIWNASGLFSKNKSIEIFNIDNSLLEKVKEDWIYDIVIKENKIKTDRLAYHRIFIFSKNWEIYTIDPFYDSNNDVEKNLNNTEILTLDKWKNFFFKKNKKNAVFKILAKYKLELLNKK